MLSSDGQKIALKIRKRYSYIVIGQEKNEMLGRKSVVTQEVVKHGMEFGLQNLIKMSLTNKSDISTYCPIYLTWTLYKCAD